MKSDKTMNDKVSKECDYFLSTIKENQRVEVFPWFVGAAWNSYSPRSLSPSLISSPRSELTFCEGVRKDKIDVDTVAAIIFKKIKEINDSTNALVVEKLLSRNRPGEDIGVKVEGEERAISTVQVRADISVSDLRKEIVDQCEIPFTYKFITIGAGSPLSEKQEEIRKVGSIIDLQKKWITIRRIDPQ